MFSFHFRGKPCHFRSDLNIILFTQLISFYCIQIFLGANSGLKVKKHGTSLHLYSKIYAVTVCLSDCIGRQNMFSKCYDLYVCFLGFFFRFFFVVCVLSFFLLLLLLYLSLAGFF